MKISIVVPVYNAESYLNECIESVINQTDDNWELVLVDDGSTDNSPKICDDYSTEYHDKIIVFHKKNEGQFLTRKLGIQHCTGDYIGFLDADDLLDKNYIKTLSESIFEHHFPDALCFGFVRFGNNLNKETKVSDCTVCFRTSDERKYVYNQIVCGQLTGSLCSKVFKKNIILNTVPDEKIVKHKRFAEDAYHSFDALANSETIVYLNSSLYLYRNNEQSFSHGFEQRTPDYFNSKYLFELIRDNLSVMGINNEKTLDSLCERNFNETVYFMLKYLRSAKNFKRKKEIIDFDWSSFLLEETVNMTQKASNIKTSYLNIWKAFKSKNYFEIIIREKFKKIIGW